MHACIILPISYWALPRKTKSSAVIDFVRYTRSKFMKKCKIALDRASSLYIFPKSCTISKFQSSKSGVNFSSRVFKSKNFPGSPWYTSKVLLRIVGAGLSKYHLGAQKTISHNGRIMKFDSVSAQHCLLQKGSFPAPFSPSSRILGLGSSSPVEGFMWRKLQAPLQFAAPFLVLIWSRLEQHLHSNILKSLDGGTHCFYFSVRWYQIISNAPS